MTATRRVTTICFHGIGQPDRDLEPGETRFWITPEHYLSILDAIAAHPGRVDITFDDGNESDHRFGLPGLAERGLTAEFFVIAGRLDERGSLSSEQLRELSAAGMGVGNHGMDHLPWREVRDDADLDHEIRGAADVIERSVGRRPVHAACPRGSYDRRVLRYLRRQGYRRVLTVDEGSSPGSAWLRTRYSVTEHDDADSVAGVLRRPDGDLATSVERAARRFIKRLR